MVCLPIHRVMSSEAFLSQINNLPVLPQIAMRVTERMQSPTATVAEISGLIKSDIGLSTKVLRLANSSYYSIPGGVTDVPKALQYLGFTTVAQIVLTTSVFAAFKSPELKIFSLTPFWMHSFAVGQLAEITARTLQLKNPSDAFVAGLMHDLGKLILLELQPEQLSKIVHLASDRGISFLHAEMDLGLKNHVELGVLLAKHWKLPENVTEAIRFHHGGGHSLDTKLIEWANLWVNHHHLGNSGNYAADVSEAMELAQIELGLSPKTLASIEVQFQKEFEKAGAILSGH
jgi:putative nucleotidyltransferase with HDIG domain